MLNTDRGADNYMIKYCEGIHEKSLVDVAPSRTAQLEMPLMRELRRTDNSNEPQIGMSSSNPSLSNIAKEGSSTPQQDYTRQPHIHIAAIDNSLSFPHEHPSGWRSYTYGWLYLPVSIIGRHFSEKTLKHFLLQAVVGRNNVPASPPLRSRSRFPSENVQCEFFPIVQFQCT
jgi:phosphatidylinositol 4-kinase type 2